MVGISSPRAIPSTVSCRCPGHRWKGRLKAPPVAFVGKGITFDTGGLCIKGAEGMENMRGDMAGAAIYLASRAGDYVVGSTLVVDGGVTHARG